LDEPDEMETWDHIVVFVTAADGEEARMIARRLLDARLAACVNIIAAIDSQFWWRGKLDSTAESLLIVKTRGRLLEEIIETVKKAHSYEVPEIIALPVIGGSREYLDWIDGEVKRDRSS
jgi:periplasmic divalent cation tolerance protein